MNVKVIFVCQDEGEAKKAYINDAFNLIILN